MGLPAASLESTPCTAVVFPGQGCQRTGMGRDFHDEFAVARRVYEEASEAIGLDLPRLCFGPDERLHLTEYAQPAIVTTELAMMRVACEEFGLQGSFYGGHSLGEYSALVASGALDLAPAVRLVRERGRLMQNAVSVGTGAMVAVISDELDDTKIQGAIRGLDVRIANVNSTTQIVVSGPAAPIKRACEAIETLLGGDRVRFVPLDVSAPFHCHLMAPVEEALEPILREATAGLDVSAAACVTSNLTGEFHSADRGAIVDALLRQISGTVRWRDNMRCLTARCTEVIEIGPGRPLRGFFAADGASVSSITSVRAARRALAQT